MKMKTLILKTFIVALLFSLSIKSETRGQSRETVVEKFAQFPNGADKFDAYLKNNLKYPADAKKDSINGFVFVRFTVKTNGAIDPNSVIVLKGLSPSCDAEAIRLIRSAPKWNAATSKTAAIDQQITFPVGFVYP